MELSERKALRRQVLEAAYKTKQAGGMRLDAEDTGIDLGDVPRRRRGLLGDLTMGGAFEITPEGEDQVEEAMDPSNRQSLLDETEESFNLEVVTVDEHRAIEAVRTEIRRFLAEHADELDADTQLDVEQQLKTVDEQMLSPKPRRGSSGRGSLYSVGRSTQSANGAVGVGAAELAPAAPGSSGRRPRGVRTPVAA